MLVSDSEINNSEEEVHGVLILVLVDVGLGRVSCATDFQPPPRLNPCFSGCWSRTVLTQSKIN